MEIADRLSADGINLHWYSSASGGQGTAVAPVPLTNSAGSFYYYVSQQTPTCESPRATIKVIITARPEVPVVRSPVIYCQGTTASVLAADGTGLHWYISADDTVELPEAPKPQTMNIGSTSYYVGRTNGFCEGSRAEIIVNVVPPNGYADAGRDTIAVMGISHQLMGSGGTSYAWTSPTAVIANPLVQNPKAIFFHDGKVFLVVKDANGCIGRDTVNVKVYTGPTYYIPTAFSPNGDGLNDVFRVIPVGIVNTSYFRIFNRYGQIVFETNQYLKGWDGTYKGVAQPMSAYVWTLKGEDMITGKLR